MHHPDPKYLHSLIEVHGLRTQIYQATLLIVGLPHQNLRHPRARSGLSVVVGPGTICWRRSLNPFYTYSNRSAFVATERLAAAKVASGGDVAEPITHGRRSGSGSMVQVPML